MEVRCRWVPPPVVEDRGYKTPCHIYQGYQTPDGYCRMSEGGGHEIMAHRFFYELACGPIPEGMEIDHLCRVRCCVNPEHLEPVTKIENLRRGLSAKLTWEKVHTMRRLYGTGEWTQTQLGRLYGVSQAHVAKIVRRQAWID